MSACAARASVRRPKTSHSQRYVPLTHARDVAGLGLEYGPTRADLWGTRGLASYFLGDAQDAVSALTQQDELDGEDDPVNWLALALAHHARGDEQLAHELYARALTQMAVHPALRDGERLWFRAGTSQQLGLE